jgi:hypothetical protein
MRRGGGDRRRHEGRDGEARKVRVANYASDVWVPRGARQMQIMPTNFSENSWIAEEERERERKRERERERERERAGERISTARYVRA